MNPEDLKKVQEPLEQALIFAEEEKGKECFDSLNNALKYIKALLEKTEKEEKITLENLKKAIDSTIKQKNKVLKSIEKTEAKEIKDTKKFIKTIKENKDLFEEKLDSDPAWLIDADKTSPLNKGLEKEVLEVKALLHDELELENELLELMKQEKRLERIYSELTKIKNLNPKLKEELERRMNTLKETIKDIEREIKTERPHLQKEEFTEKQLEKLLDTKQTPPGERIKPTWNKYKEADEHDIPRYVAVDKAFFSELKKLIKAEKENLNEILEILSEKGKKVEEEAKPEIKRFKVLTKDGKKVPKEWVPYGTELVFKAKIKGREPFYWWIQDSKQKWVGGKDWKTTGSEFNYPTTELVEGPHRMRFVAMSEADRGKTPGAKYTGLSDDIIDIKITKATGEKPKIESFDVEPKEAKEGEKITFKGKILGNPPFIYRIYDNTARKYIELGSESEDGNIEVSSEELHPDTHRIVLYVISKSNEKRYWEILKDRKLTNQFIAIELINVKINPETGGKKVAKAKRVTGKKKKK